MNRAPDFLMREMERAEGELMDQGLEKIAVERPHVLQLVLTGRLIREIRSIGGSHANGNGTRRQTAVKVGVPAVGGAGIFAMVLEAIRLLA